MKRRPPSRPIPPIHEVETPFLTHGSNPPPSSSSWLRQMVSTSIQHPWVLWGSAWVVTVILSSIALALLSNPLFTTLPPSPSRDDADLAPPATAVPDHGSTSPFWALGAIAFTSVLGSMMISRSGKRR
ncbi:MAG TPA: hypothetical protein V6D20_12665 [Candidatus Obscuribacterales bacterium]